MKIFNFLIYSSGEDRDSYPCLRIGPNYNKIRIPPIIKPHIYKYKYKEILQRAYGFYLFTEADTWDSIHFVIYYGVIDESYQKGAPKVKQWSCFLPWTTWRVTKNELLNPNGTTFANVRSIPWKRYEELLEACPKEEYEFLDFDGEVIRVTCHKSYMRWDKGEGWFKWLSRFIPPKERVSVNFRFHSEVGRSKGSWKGGVTGTGIDSSREEPIKSALSRWTDKHLGDC